VAPPAVCAALLTCTDEAALVRALTPTLRALRGCVLGDAAALEADACARVLVNSERAKWLDGLGAALPLSQRKKPDLFLTHYPFWRGMVREGAAFGVLSGRDLQLDGCVREIFEAKDSVSALTTSDFGQFFDYLANLPGVSRGALFDRRALWLCEALDGTPVRLVKTTWDATGSRALFVGFFESPAPEPALVTTARLVMKALSVRPCEEDAGAGSFLGAGATGRVFCVRAVPPAGGAPARLGGAAAPWALKLSCAASAGDLMQEFALLSAAAARGAPVVRVVPNSLRDVSDAGGRRVGSGYLMAEVLAPVLITSRRRCRDAFAALAALHAADIAHGDARLPNLLARSGGGGGGAQLVWVDLCVAGTGAAACAADRAQLAASVLRPPAGDAPALPAGVARALAERDAAGEGDYDAVADAVYVALAAQAAQA